MKLTLLIIDSPVKMPDIFEPARSRRVSMFGDVNNVELGSEFRDGIVRRIGPALKAAEKTLFIKIEDEQLLRSHPSGEATSSMRCCSHKLRNRGMSGCLISCYETMSSSVRDSLRKRHPDIPRFRRFYGNNTASRMSLHREGWNAISCSSSIFMNAFFSAAFNAGPILRTMPSRTQIPIRRC